MSTTAPIVVPFVPGQHVTDWNPLPAEGDVVIQRGNVKVILVTWVDPVTGKVNYSQILRCEQGGGLTLLVDDLGRIGLITVYRPVVRDQAEWAAQWPNVNPQLLGRPSLELPRGFPKVGDPTAEDTSLREAGEEAGLTLSAIRSYSTLAMVSDNTTFSPHLTTFVVARVDSAELGKNRPQPDPNEGILKGVQWFTLPALKGLVDGGYLFCGYTLSAIGAYLLDEVSRSAAQHAQRVLAAH